MGVLYERAGTREQILRFRILYAGIINGIKPFAYNRLFNLFYDVKLRGACRSPVYFLGKNPSGARKIYLLLQKSALLIL